MWMSQPVKGVWSVNIVFLISIINKLLVSRRKMTHAEFFCHSIRGTHCVVVKSMSTEIQK